MTVCVRLPRRKLRLAEPVARALACQHHALAQDAPQIKVDGRKALGDQLPSLAAAIGVFRRRAEGAEFLVKEAAPGGRVDRFCLIVDVDNVVSTQTTLLTRAYIDRGASEYRGFFDTGGGITDAGDPPPRHAGERQQPMIDIAAQRSVKLHVRVTGTSELPQDAGDRLPTRIIVGVGQDHLY